MAGSRAGLGQRARRGVGVVDVQGEPRPLNPAARCFGRVVCVQGEPGCPNQGTARGHRITGCLQRLRQRALALGSQVVVGHPGGQCRRIVQGRNGVLGTPPLNQQQAQIARRGRFEQALPDVPGRLQGLAQPGLGGFVMPVLEQQQSEIALGIGGPCTISDVLRDRQRGLEVMLGFALASAQIERATQVAPDTALPSAVLRQLRQHKACSKLPMACSSLRAAMSTVPAALASAQARIGSPSRSTSP